jgi:hypothetical protein
MTGFWIDGMPEETLDGTIKTLDTRNREDNTYWIWRYVMGYIHVNILNIRADER